MAKSEPEEWKWRVGILMGLGEAAWQESNGRIQKLTILVVAQGRVGLVKCVSPMCMSKVSPDFPADKMVVAGEEPTLDFIEDLKRFWAGGRILMGNGGDLPGPRRMP